jgi:hypothetical protein
VSNGGTAQAEDGYISGATVLPTRTAPVSWPRTMFRPRPTPTAISL